MAAKDCFETKHFCVHPPMQNNQSNPRKIKLTTQGNKPGPSTSPILSGLYSKKVIKQPYEFLKSKR